jgi:hypothetical protein
MADEKKPPALETYDGTGARCRQGAPGRHGLIGGRPMDRLLHKVLNTLAGTGANHAEPRAW